MLDFSVTFGITIINIVILFFILRAILFKPVSKFMADRAQRVRNTLDQAAEEKAAAQALREEYQRKLESAQAEADQIVSDARKKAELEAQQIIADGKALAAALCESGRKQLESERHMALARFRLEAATLVMAASARLVQKDFSSEDNRQYANLLLEELGNDV